MQNLRIVHLSNSIRISALIRESPASTSIRFLIKTMAVSFSADVIYAVHVAMLHNRHDQRWK